MTTSIEEVWSLLDGALGLLSLSEPNRRLLPRPKQATQWHLQKSELFDQVREAER